MSEEGCYEDYDCNEWSECHTTFSLKEIVNNNISLKGAKERDCFSTKGCLKDKTQTQTCDFKVDIYAINAFWCYENYVEIYVNGTNQLVSRVKETEISEQINLSRVDINFPIQTEKERAEKLKELKFELVKSGVTANKFNAKTKEIKRAISRLITFGKSAKEELNKK